MTRGIARSRGFAIAYEDIGTGPPVVLVNGYASPATEWTDVGYTERLVERYRVLAVDSLGHGLSERSPEPDDYRLPDAASDIVAAMDAAGIERAALWGYSRGAKLVATAAVEFPDRVAALILGGFWPPTGVTTDEVEPATEALLRSDWDTFWELVGDGVSAEDRRYMQESSDPLAMAAVDLGANRSDYVIDASRISAPTLLYYGAEDAADPRMGTSLDAFGAQRILEGHHDHFTAFTDAASVAPVVLRFLHNVYPPNPS